MSPSTIERRESLGSKESPIALHTVLADHDSSQMHDEEPLIEDKPLERRIRRKVDLHLIVPLWVIFLIGFLDRINIGNVAVLGLPRDLHLKGNQFNIALQIFFVTYIVFDLPGNLLLQHTRPSWLIPGMAFLWGISALCQGLVHSFAGLVVCRLFIGVFESNFMAAAVFLMASYYKRNELQFRFNIFWSAAILAGAVGGLLAYAINHMGGIRGLEGWRWVLIFEGILASSTAILAFFWLADWPQQARFLTPKEKAFWIQRTQGSAVENARMERLDRRTAWRIAKDWKIWCGTVMYLCTSTSGYGAALFFPTILTSIGYTGVQAQVKSIPVWVAATVVALTTGFLSDAIKHRYAFILAGLCVSIPGYVLLICQGPVHGGLHRDVRYMAVFLVAIGTQMIQPIALVWVTANLGGAYKRSIGPAAMSIGGSIGGIIASNVFVAKDAPRYFVGYGVVLGLLVLGGFASSLFALGLVIENRKRERGERDDRLQLSKEEQANLGDDHPSFRFTM